MRAIVYANFADEVGEGTIVDLPGVMPGTDWERFRAKARAYLRDHEDHLALQRLRRNHQLGRVANRERAEPRSGVTTELSVRPGPGQVSST